MSFFGISNSLIYKNQLGFTDAANLDMLYYLELTLDVAYEKINLKLVNKHVFKYVNNLTLMGNFYDIDHDLFRYFEH